MDNFNANYVFSGLQAQEPEQIEDVESQKFSDGDRSDGDQLEQIEDVESQKFSDGDRSDGDQLQLCMSKEQEMNGDVGTVGDRSDGDQLELCISKEQEMNGDVGTVEPITTTTNATADTNDATCAVAESDVFSKNRCLPHVDSAVPSTIPMEQLDTIVESVQDETSSEGSPILRGEVIESEEPPLKKQKKDLAAQLSFVCTSSIIPASQNYLACDISLASVEKVQKVISEFRQRLGYWRNQGKRKGDMIAYKEMKQQFEKDTAEYEQYCKRFRSHGHIDGVKIGDQFSCRAEIALVGVHDELVRGIYSVEGQPAFAICLSGAYADDEDQGDCFVYTGEGGQRSGVQVMDQKKDKGNLALTLCCDKRIPVRVIRGGHDENKKLSYYYDGLFMVEKYEMCQSQQQKVITEARVKSVIQNLKNKSSKTRILKNNNIYSENPKIFKFYMRGIPGHCRASQVIQFRNAFTSVRLAHVKISIAGLRFYTYLSSEEISRRDDKRMEALKQKESQGYLKLLTEDLAQGKERVKIPVVVPRQFFQDNVVLPDFEYTSQNCNWTDEAQNLNFDYAMYQWKGCGVQRCGNQYNNAGCLLYTDFKGVFECGIDCNNTSTCKQNMVTQNGLYLPLEVRWFGGKGFGVTCAVSIPAGAFICEYFGQVMTDLEAEFQRKGKDKYLYSLHHFLQLFQIPPQDKLGEEDVAKLPPMSKEHMEKQDQPHLVIDALFHGNVGRFINHSCDPNVTTQVVLKQNSSFLHYSLCFFASKDISAGTELCYDYFWSPMQDSTGCDDQVYCRCGAAQCKGRLL